MTVKYIIARLERVGNQIKHLPVLEFDTHKQAQEALNKVKSNQYAIVPMIIE